MVFDEVRKDRCRTGSVLFGGLKETLQQVVARFKAMNESDGLRQRLT